MKSFPTLRDFLSPVWRYTLDDKFKDNPNVRFNRAFLRAIDNQLKAVGNKTVASRVDLYLNSARHEYLDYFGSWIGLERLNGKESDDHYRKRLIHHVEHPRSTIPALRSAISTYLHDGMSDVHIYEPWQDTFLTNDYASRTNSRSHLYGYYYRPAIINIVINKPFTDMGVIDYINWFRPVGVEFLITYDNGQYSDLWHMPTLTPVFTDMVKTDFIGFTRNKNYDLNLLDENNMYGDDPFYVSYHADTRMWQKLSDQNKTLMSDTGTDLSNLNSHSVLMDNDQYDHKYRSYLGTLHSLLATKDNDTVDDMMYHTELIDPHSYSEINDPHGLPITITSSLDRTDNLLNHTFDLKGNWAYSNGTGFYSGLEDNGRASIRLADSSKRPFIEYDGYYFFNSQIDEKQYPTDYQIKVGDERERTKDTTYQKGQWYYIGVDLRADDPYIHDQSDSSDYIEVQLTDKDTVQLGGQCYPDKWVHFSGKFLYNGGKIVPPKFTWVKGNSAYMEISSPIISKVSDKWCPSRFDLDTRFINDKVQTGMTIPSPNSEYIYSFINVWAFYFNHIESRRDVYQKLTNSTATPTPYQVNNYISKHIDTSNVVTFAKRYLTLTYTPQVNATINTRLWIMNYGLKAKTVGDKGYDWRIDTPFNAWVNYDTHQGVLGKQPDTYHLEFHDIAPLLNNHGMMVIALQVPAYRNNYELDLNHLGLTFQRYYPHEQSIRLFGHFIEYWWNITDYLFPHAFSDGTKGNSFNQHSRGRAQRYYPIRYIRDWVKNIHYGTHDDDIFRVNDSLLNGTDLLDEYHRKWIRPYFPNWIHRPIISSLTDSSNPVKSVSVLGVHAGDDYPANRLNNLLKNSIFRYFDDTLVWGHSTVKPQLDEDGDLIDDTSTIMRKDVNSDHVWFNNRGSKLWTTTESVGSRNRYVLSFSAYTPGDFDKVFNVRVKLFSNDYVQNLDKKIVVTQKRQNYHLIFNTYGIYPDHVTFVWTYLGDSKSRPEKFIDLKENENTFSQFKDKSIRFRDLEHVISPDGEITAGSVKTTKGKLPSLVKTVRRRPNNIFMPDEPAYVYYDGSAHLTQPPKKNKDIDPGWNFNGLIPDYMYPAMIPDGNGGFTPGYIPKDADTSKLQLAYVPDYKGDYALGYTFQQGTSQGWDLAKLEQTTTGKFVSCLVPSHFIYYTTTNSDTADIEFRDIACRLGATVYVNDKDNLWKQIDHYAPQINYKGQDTLAYNDIIFGQPIVKDNINSLIDNLHTFSQYSTFLYHRQWEFLNFTDGGGDNNLTWNQLEQTGLTWNDLQRMDYTWQPGFNMNQLEELGVLKNLSDATTYKDLLPQTTYKEVEKHDWLYLDGEPFDTSEHCVTVDLGRTYTNIDHLLVHHGSGSIPDAVYDSCLQTSIDGKHWHTWYDNYKGVRKNQQLDHNYVEPVNTPISVPVAQYDCLNSRRDYHRKLNNRNYVHSQVIHYPVKTVSSLIFDDDRHNIPLYMQWYYASPSVTTPYTPSVKDLSRFKMNTHPTKSNGKPNTLDRNNSDWLDLQESISNNDISSNHYWNAFHPTTPNYYQNNPVFAEAPKGKQVKAQDKLSAFQIYPSVSRVIAHRVAPIQDLADRAKRAGIPLKDVLNKKNLVDEQNRVKKQNKFYANMQRVNQYYIMHENNPATPLNSQALLQDGHGVPEVPHTNSVNSGQYAGDLPHPKYSPYIYDTKLLRFDLSNAILNQYPNLYHNLRVHGISEPDNFTSGLISNCTTLKLRLNVATNGTWAVALWDYAKKSWQHATINIMNGLGTLSTDHFTDCLKNGQLYVLIRATINRSEPNPYLNLNSADLVLDLHMDEVNRYRGGLYPHVNYEYNDNKLYDIEPKNRTTILKLPWVDKKVLGHKITISFNMVANVTGDIFQLRFGRLHTHSTQIEHCFQNFSFTFDVPHDVTNGQKGNITPRLVLNGNVGHIYIYGFKAELGIKQTPYTFPV